MTGLEFAQEFVSRVRAKTVATERFWVAMASIEAKDYIPAKQYLKEAVERGLLEEDQFNPKCQRIKELINLEDGQSRLWNLAVKVLDRLEKGKPIEALNLFQNTGVTIEEDIPVGLRDLYEEISRKLLK